MPVKDIIPPPGLPVRSFNEPGHIEAVHVERVDVTDTNYRKLPRGTPYATLQGADQRVIDTYPGLFLLREIISPRNYPWAFRYWGLAESFTTQSIGQQNLIPAKYRRLIRTVETNQPVGADYAFPAGLTGDQTLVELAQETIEEARLRIIFERIALNIALVGQHQFEFRIESIIDQIGGHGAPAHE